jgi:UDP:flavonoid glycosyltransferase YjiC (YdhE family)
MLKKAMFLPSFGGRGFGHINRCLSLASEFSRQNWETAFVLAGSNTVSIEKAGHQVYRPHFLRYPSHKPPKLPAYLVLQDGGGQALRDGLTRPWRLWLAISEVIGFIKHFRPDVLIGDSSLLTWIVGQKVQLPVIQVVQSIVHPLHAKIIWWQQPPINPIPLDIRPAFNPLLEYWDLSPIRQSEDLLKGDLYLVPGIPATDPLPDGLANTHYIGALIHESSQYTKLPAPLDNPMHQPILYVTLGGSANPNLTYKIYKTVSSIVTGTAWWVIMSLGSRFQSQQLVDKPPNMFCYQWLPGWATIQKSNAILFHGGHTTMMESVCAGIPAIVIPSHSEQEGNGRRLEACSAGIVISPAENSSALNLVRSNWEYGKFTSWTVPEYDLDSEKLTETMLRLVEDPCYKQGAEHLKLLASRYGGARAAVDLIDSFLR